MGSPDAMCVWHTSETLLRAEADNRNIIPNLTCCKQECGIKNMAIIGENWHGLELRFIQGSITMTLKKKTVRIGIRGSGTF